MEVCFYYKGHRILAEIFNIEKTDKYIDYFTGRFFVCRNEKRKSIYPTMCQEIRFMKSIDKVLQGV